MIFNNNLKFKRTTLLLKNTCTGKSKFLKAPTVISYPKVVVSFQLFLHFLSKALIFVSIQKKAIIICKFFTGSAALNILCKLQDMFWTGWRISISVNLRCMKKWSYHQSSIHAAIVGRCHEVLTADVPGRLLHHWLKWGKPQKINELKPSSVLLVRSKMVIKLKDINREARS